jgi:hypothetical protein
VIFKHAPAASNPDVLLTHEAALPSGDPSALEWFLANRAKINGRDEHVKKIRYTQNGALRLVVSV